MNPGSFIPGSVILDNYLTFQSLGLMILASHAFMKIKCDATHKVLSTVSGTQQTINVNYLSLFLLLNSE